MTSMFPLCQIEQMTTAYHRRKSYYFRDLRIHPSFPSKNGKEKHTRRQPITTLDFKPMKMRGGKKATEMSRVPRTEDRLLLRK